MIIEVKENKVIGNISYDGVKAKKILEALKSNLVLKRRSSFTEYFLKKDKEKIISNLKELGFYFSTVVTYVEEKENNNSELTFEIKIGNKAKIKNNFTGDKIYKNSELKELL